MTQTCAICHSGLQEGKRPWHFACGSCGFECSSLKPSINDNVFHDAHIDEGARHMALAGLRLHNFKTILTALRRFTPPRPDVAILDVGCAYGWFLGSARDEGYHAVGIEPEDKIAEAARARGYEVLHGYFPGVLAADDRFDVIIFNDVFEHLPDIAAAAAAIHMHVKPGGLAVINGPNRRGFFYRLSKWLLALGWEMPFERMWQKNYASPHVSYFVPADVAGLFVAHGFEEIERLEMTSLQIKGLWSRLAYDRSHGLIQRLVIYAGTLVMAPFVRLFPSDTVAQFFRKI